MARFKKKFILFTTIVLSVLLIAGAGVFLPKAFRGAEAAINVTSEKKGEVSLAELCVRHGVQYLYVPGGNGGAYMQAHPELQKIVDEQIIIEVRNSSQDYDLAYSGNTLLGWNTGGTDWLNGAKRSSQKSLFVIPKNVTTVTTDKDHKFNYDSNANQSFVGIAFEEGSALTTISNNAFAECDNLRFCILPQRAAGSTKTITIGNQSFWRTCILQDIVLPEGVTTIGNEAFRDAFNLMHISIPSTVTSLGTNAFSHTYALCDVEIDSNNVDASQFGAAMNVYGKSSKIAEAEKTKSYLYLTDNIANSFAFCYNNRRTDALATISNQNQNYKKKNWYFVTFAGLEDKNVSGMGGTGNTMYYFPNSVDITAERTNIGWDYLNSAGIKFLNDFSASTDESGKIEKYDIGFGACYNKYFFHAVFSGEDGLNDAITVIGDYAFCNSHVTHADIPASVTHIGNFALSGVGSASEASPSRAYLANQFYYFRKSASDNLYTGSYALAMGTAWQYPATSVSPITIDQSHRWIIFTDKNVYSNEDREKFNRVGDKNVEYTYLVPIKTNVKDDSGNTVTETVTHRLLGQAYNYTQNADGFWSAKTGSEIPAMPNLPENVSTVWYSDEQYITKCEQNDITQLLSASANPTEINLYTRRFGEPLTDIKTYTYEKNGDATVQHDPADALGIDKKNFSAKITKLINPIGNPATTPSSVGNAGTYTIEVALSEIWGVRKENYTYEVTVNQAEVDLGLIENLPNFRTENGALGGDNTTLYEYTDGWYAYEKMDAAYSGTAVVTNSYVRYTGDEFQVGTQGMTLYSVESGQNTRATDTGVYNGRFILRLNETGDADGYNYKFTSASVEANRDKLLPYGLVVETIESNFQVATIAKKWYIVVQSNWLVDKDNEGSTSFVLVTGDDGTSVRGWEYEAEGGFHIHVPKVANGDTPVTFTLDLVNGNTTVNIVTDRPVAELENYLNSAMPVGSYRIMLTAEATTAGDAKFSEIRESTLITVTRKPLDSAAIEAVLTNGTFEKAYSGTLYFHDDIDNLVADLNAKLNTVRQDALVAKAWNDPQYDSYYQNEVTLSYNLDRMQNSNYYEFGDTHFAAFSAVNKYNVYYSLAAKNYVTVGGSDANDRRDYHFQTVIYRVIETSDFALVGKNASGQDSISYTGSDVRPSVPYNQYYSYTYSDANYVDVRNGCQIIVTLNDSELSRWGTANKPAHVAVSGEHNEIVTITFNIQATANSWQILPQIPGWAFDGFNAEVHTITSSLRFGNTAVYFRIGSLMPNGSYEWVDFGDYGAEYNGENNYFQIDANGKVNENIARVLNNLKPGEYWLAGFAAAYEPNEFGFSNVNAFETLADSYGRIIVGKAVNLWTTSPNMVRWNWSEFNKSVNRISATPRYLNVADLTGLNVKFTVLDAEKKAYPGLIAFTLGDDGLVSAAVADVLAALDAGNYYLLATVDKTDYYTGLNELPETLTVEGGTLLDGYGLDLIPFDVAQKNNFWQVSPAMTSWRYEQFATTNFREGTPAFPSENKKVIYGIFERDITEKPASSEAFKALEGGKFFENISAVETYLRALGYGENKYHLAAYAEGSNNYTDLFATVPFSVLTAENGWQTTPGITSWQYKGFTDANFIEGVPTYPKTNAQVTYGVKKTDTEPTEFAAFEHTFADVDQLKEYLFGLEVGTYYLAAYVEKDTDYGSLYLALRFTVGIATNTWETAPRLTGWTYKSFTENNFTAGEAVFDEKDGEVVHYEIILGGKTEVSWNGALTSTVTEAIKALSANKDTEYYTLKVTFAGTDNYTGIDESVITFRITQANNSWRTTPGLTGWKYNAFTTANFTEGEPALNEGGNFIQYVIKKSDGTQIVKFTNDPSDTNIESESVRSALEALSFGDYTLDATLEGTGNHGGLTQHVTFQVTQENNSWKTMPNLVGWQYKAFSTSNFTAGDPTYIAQGTSVQYGIFTQRLQTSDDFKGAAGETVLARFEALTGNVTVGGKTMTVAEYLQDLDEGTYYFAAYVPADNGQNYGELFLCVPVVVARATTNAWKQAPSISGWTYGATKTGSLLIDGEAAFGELRYTVQTVDAQGNVEGSVSQDYENLTYEALVARFNGTQLNAGNYNLHVITLDSRNYNQIEHNVRFAVEKAENAWATVPTIEGWTYGGTAKTPTEGVTVHEPDEVVGDPEYYPAQQVNGVWVANKTAGAIENIATADAGTYAYEFTASATTNYKELTHTAIFVISPKGNAWTVEPEGTLTWVWGFAGIGNTNLAKARAQENGAGVQYTIRNTATNSIENPEGETIAEKLANLGAGDYEIISEVKAGTNYEGISKITYLTVTKANFTVNSEIRDRYAWEWEDENVAIFADPSEHITKAKSTDKALITYVVTTQKGDRTTYVDDYAAMSAYVLALGAGTHEIQITITNGNYNDYAKTVAITVTKASFTVGETQGDTSWSWNKDWTAADGGRDIIPTTVSDKKGATVTPTYTIGDDTYTYNELVAYLQGNLDVGGYVVKVSVAQEGYENYNDLGVTFTVAVTQAENSWIVKPQTAITKEYGTDLTAGALVLARATFGSLVYTGYDPQSGKTLLEWVNSLPSGTHTLTTGVAADPKGNYKILTPVTTVITVVGIGGAWDNENELHREYEFPYSSNLSEQMATVKIPVKTWGKYPELVNPPEGEEKPKLTYKVTYTPYSGIAVSPVLDNTKEAVEEYLKHADREAGTYTIQVDYDPNNPNYAKLSYTVTVRVTRGVISWSTRPEGLYNKPFEGFEADVLTPNAGEGHTVVYNVTGTVNETDITISDFRAYLNGLSVGEYTITYRVEETNNYTGLDAQTVTVTIYKAANQWKDTSILEKSHTVYRVNGNYDKLVIPEAVHGDVVTTLTKPDGTSSSPAYSQTITTFAQWLASQNLAAGEYGISFLVKETANYNGLLYECTLTVAKNNNDWTTGGEPDSSYSWTGAAGTFKIPTPEVGANLLRFDIAKAGDAKYTQEHQNLTKDAFEDAIEALVYGTYTVTVRVGGREDSSDLAVDAIRTYNTNYVLLSGTTTIVFERAGNSFTTGLSDIVKTYGKDAAIAQLSAGKGIDTVVYTISGTKANGDAFATKTFAADKFAEFQNEINALEAGTYTITASIAQTTTYEAATTSATVTVNKVTTEWNLTDEELNAYKGNLAFTWNDEDALGNLLPVLSLKNWAGGVIKYTVDGKILQNIEGTQYNEGTWVYELGTKNEGTYRITAYVEGDNNHTALSFETTVVVDPVTTAWTAETEAKDGERLSWIYNKANNPQPTQPVLTQASIDAGATITYTLVNADSGAQIDSGDWTKVTGTLALQTAGTYTITASVARGTNHTALTFTSTVVISVAANVWTKHVGEDATVEWIYGHHAENDPDANVSIAYEAEHNNGALTITVNNVRINGDLMDYLKAQPVGTYVIVASVPATAEYGALTETITLTIGKSTENGWSNGGLVINNSWTWTDVTKHTADDEKGYYVGADLGLVMPVPKFGDTVLIIVKSGATEVFSLTVPYVNGVANDAVVETLQNRLWALDAGSYTITAQIPETENYAQFAQAAISFTVAQATNMWLESPAIGGWSYGGETVYPTSQPKFGNKNDVVYMYAPVKGADGAERNYEQVGASEWKTALPALGGRYFIRGTLVGTNNYSALDASYKVLDTDPEEKKNCYSIFTIQTGANAWVNNVSVVSWNWDGYNREVNLFGGSARSGGIVHYVIKKLVSGNEVALDKNDFSIEITQEQWENSIKQILSDITLTKASDYKFVSGEIAALLKALKPGDYVLNATVNADDNFAAIEGHVNFTVGKATNDWATNADGSAKLPGVVSFTYGAPIATGNRVSFTAGEAKYGNVNYKITGTKNDGTSYESAVLHTAEEVYDLFEGLDAGNYVLNVWFDSDASLYDALYSEQSPFVLPFNVARANNSWNTSPTADPLSWFYADVHGTGFDFAAKFGTPAVAHGDIVYTVLGTDFTTALAGEYSYANLYKDAILNLRAGEYIVRLTVGQSCNYNVLTADVSLTLKRQANSFTAIPASFTGEWHLDADGVSNNSTIAITDTTVAAAHGTIVYAFGTHTYTTVADLQNAVKACDAGSYQITVSVEENNYYEGLTRTLQLDIAQGANSWNGWNVGTSLKAGDSVMRWAWNSAVEWTAGAPKYGTTVYVEIVQKNTTTALRRILVDFSVDGGESGIEAVNTFVSGLDRGFYSIVVTAPADDNWAEMKTRAEDAVFEVMQAENGWKTDPYLYNTTDNKYVYGTTVQPYAEALHGTVEYKYYAKTTSGYSPLAAAPVNAGDYKVEFIVTEPATGNYKKIEAEIDFTIEKAEVTSFIKSPSASGWIWNGYNRLSNLFTAIPTSGGAVTYSVFDASGKLVVDDIRLADALGVLHGDFDKDIYVPADKAEEIAALNAGKYTLRVDVAEVENYKSFYTTVDFDITEAENTWIVAPQLVGWAQNNWNATDYTPMATSRFGEVTIYVRNKINGDIYYERSYNSATGKYEVKINQLNLAKAGRLVMTASVAKSPNQYHATNERGEFVDLEGSIEVEIYPVGSSENNVWLTSPGIVGWEASVDAPVNLPYGEPLRGWAYFVFYDAEGHEIVAGEDSYLVEKGDTYYRDFYVPMAPGTYRMEAFAVNEDIEGNVIEADNLHARNITLIISYRKNSFTLEPRIPTLLYLGEKSDKTKWVDPTATAALADSTITFTYTLKETGEEYHDLNEITKDGTYTLKAVVEAKYCVDLTFTVDFEVALSQNSWIDIPVIKDWSEEDGPSEPEGKTEFGDIVYEYFEKRGDELVALEGKPTREGTYVLRATAYQEGFAPLVNEFEFTVTPTFDTTLLAVDISLACVLCAVTVVVIVFAIRRYKENG